MSTTKKDDQLFILDNGSRALSICNLGPTEVTYSDSLPLPEKMINGVFIPSQQSRELIIKNEESYFTFDITTKTFNEIDFEEKRYYYPKKEFVKDDKLYVLAQRACTKQKKSIFVSNRTLQSD